MLRLLPAIACVVLLGCSTEYSASPTPLPPTDPPPEQEQPGPRLALLAGTCTFDKTGYNRCTGSVQNLTSTSIDNVEAVIEWTDENGVVQSSDSALIDYDPLLAGQTSPWSVLGRRNPALTRFRVQFKELSGGTIATRDDR